LAKEDHIYRLNHVLNSLFRFTLHNFNIRQLWNSVALANFLFDHVGLDCFSRLPPPSLNSISCTIVPPAFYATLITFLHAPRPLKIKPMCSNCNTKVASRRKLCVACYRYHLKHGEPRPLRLIVANRPGPRHNLLDSYNNNQTITKTNNKKYGNTTGTRSRSIINKHCANCGVQETHQWYRNLCGQGHWCETCKSYYLRHNKVRPPELFVKAAKRKVDVRFLVSWASWACDQHEEQQQDRQQRRLSSSSSTTTPTSVTS
ncbi:uncharacterized protein BX664DRAFT_240968, partial [Halteromyces radiatus]|uniref:uncharacterized protein n=1 Tax=Halteromyces radiatus TaxID=101107 RepID=UPI00221E53F2